MDKIWINPFINKVCRVYWLKKSAKIAIISGVVIMAVMSTLAVLSTISYASDQMSGQNNTMQWRQNGTMQSSQNSNTKSMGNIDISMASPVKGSESAPVTIVEFGDYQCEKCDGWFKNEEPTVVSNYIDTNKAKLYFMDFPFLGPDSVPAAQAAYCADEEGKYWGYHDTLYTNQGAIQSGWVSTDNLKQFAGKLGLNTDQFSKCLDSGKYTDRVTHNKAVGAAVGVQGTPTFFIIGSNGNTQEIDGPQPASVFAQTIDKMIASATPEFGPVAPIVLAVAIVGIIAVTAKGKITSKR